MKKVTKTAAELEAELIAIKEAEERKSKIEAEKAYLASIETERDLASFTDADREEKAKCEAVIQAHVNEFIAVGQAILKIKIKQLYKLDLNPDGTSKYTKFSDYIADKFAIEDRSQQHIMNAYRYNALLQGVDETKLIDVDASTIKPILNTSAIQNIPAKLIKTAQTSTDKSKILNIIVEKAKEKGDLTGKNIGAVIPQIEQEIYPTASKKSNAKSKAKAIKQKETKKPSEIKKACDYIIKLMISVSESDKQHLIALRDKLVSVYPIKSKKDKNDVIPDKNDVIQDKVITKLGNDLKGIVFKKNDKLNIKKV